MFTVVGPCCDPPCKDEVDQFREPHKKVYTAEVFTSIPPQYVWVCTDCGETGQDVLKFPPKFGTK